MFLLTSSVHSNDTYGDSTQRFKTSHDAGDHLFRNDNNKFTDVTTGLGHLFGTDWLWLRFKRWRPEQRRLGRYIRK
jgi:hypothetical protein